VVVFCALGTVVVYAFVQIANVCMVFVEAKMKCIVSKIC
jgi:hypothetical protein